MKEEFDCLGEEVGVVLLEGLHYVRGKGQIFYRY